MSIDVSIVFIDVFGEDLGVIYVSLGVVGDIFPIVFFFPDLLELETASVYLKTTSAFFFFLFLFFFH